MAIQFLNTHPFVDVSKLRTDAKKLAREQGIPLSTAQNEIALDLVGQPWSEMISDHVITLDKNNALSFSVTGPDNRPWAVQAQVSSSFETLRDEMISGRSLAWRGRAFGQRGRNRIEFDLGPRETFFGNGTEKFTFPDSVASSIRGLLMSESQRLRAAGTSTAISFILEQQSSYIWNNVHGQSFTAITIDPNDGEVIHTSHDGTLDSLLELSLRQAGQNLKAQLIDGNGVLAVYLDEDFTEGQGMTVIGDLQIRGRVVIIARDPETGEACDLPELLPALSWIEGSPGRDLFSDFLNDPDNIWKAGSDEFQFGSIPEDCFGDGAIRMERRVDLCRVTDPVFYVARHGDEVITLRRGDYYSRLLRIHSLSGGKEFEILGRNFGPFGSSGLLHELKKTFGLDLPAGHWSRRGLEVDGEMIVEPVQTADLSMYAAREEAALQKEQEQVAVLASCPPVVTGGKKGDWLSVEKPVSFIQDLGFDIDLSICPSTPVSQASWLVLVHHNHARAAILFQTGHVPSDIMEWPGQGRLYVSSDLDAPSTYACSLADLFVGIFQDMETGLEFAEDVIRASSDAPEFSIHEHLGITPEGTPLHLEPADNLSDDEKAAFRKGVQDGFNGVEMSGQNDSYDEDDDLYPHWLYGWRTAEKELYLQNLLNTKVKRG